MPCRISGILPGENLATNVTCGGRVCSYRLRPPTSYTVWRQLTTVQRTRRLAEVGWLTGDGSGIQMTWSCRRQYVTMRALWVGQTDDGIYDITACCQFDHQLIVSYGNSKIGYEIIHVSHPYMILTLTVIQRTLETSCKHHWSNPAAAAGHPWGCTAGKHIPPPRHFTTLKVRHRRTKVIMEIQTTTGL